MKGIAVIPYYVLMEISDIENKDAFYKELYALVTVEHVRDRHGLGSMKIRVRYVCRFLQVSKPRHR